MKKYRLLGTTIQVLHKKIAYTDKDGYNQVAYELDQANADSIKRILEMQGCAEITISNADTSDVDWLDGIEIGETRDAMAEADRIYAMGEQAYLTQKNALTVEQQLMLTQLKQQQAIDALIMAQLGGTENV